MNLSAICLIGIWRKIMNLKIGEKIRHNDEFHCHDYLTKGKIYIVLEKYAADCILIENDIGEKVLIWKERFEQIS
jgi:hypothetical protein